MSSSEKEAVYARYEVEHVPYTHEVDHLISLEIGGSNDIRNLWPEPYAGRWGARTKDVLENRLHDLVCSGRLSPAPAQQQEARDWVAAYRRYVGGPPSGGGRRRQRRWDERRRLLRVELPDRSTIYCADDPAWHEPLVSLPGALRHARAGEGAVPELPPAPALLTRRGPPRVPEDSRMYLELRRSR